MCIYIYMYREREREIHTHVISEAPRHVPSFGFPAPRGHRGAASWDDPEAADGMMAIGCRADDNSRYCYYCYYHCYYY